MELTMQSQKRSPCSNWREIMIKKETQGGILYIHARFIATFKQNFVIFMLLYTQYVVEKSVEFG